MNSSNIAGKSREVTTGTSPEKANAEDAKYAIFAWIGVFCIFIAIGILIAPPSRSVGSPTEEWVDTTAAPIQTNLVTGEVAPIVWQRGNFTWTLIPRARYQIAARVLGNKAYNRDWQSPVAPLDLALAWGELGDPDVDEWLEWYQDSRWYHYYWKGDSPYTGNAIVTQSANTHIIPATEELATILGQVGVNNRILLEGFLVDVEVRNEANGPLLRHANTSLVRTDSGEFSCEILYVEQLTIGGKEYR